MSPGSFLNPNETLKAANLAAGQHVADIAAGSGFFTRAAARLVGPTGEVWAVDNNRELLSRIKNIALAEGLENVDIVQGNPVRAQGTHLPSEVFDLVIAANMFFTHEQIEYIPILKEIERILKPGGHALIIDWSGSHGGLGPHPDHVITQTQMSKLISQIGLVTMREVPTGGYHWGLMVRKVNKENAQ